MSRRNTDLTEMLRDRRPVSWYSITVTGRERLAAHLSALQALMGGD